MGSWQINRSIFSGGSSRYPGIADFFISTCGPPLGVGLSNLRLLPPLTTPNTSRIVQTKSHSYTTSNNTQSLTSSHTVQKRQNKFRNNERRLELTQVCIALSLRGLYHFDNKTKPIVFISFDFDIITIFLKSHKIRV